MNDTAIRDLIAKGRALLPAEGELLTSGQAFDLAEWAGLNLPALLDALESAQQAIEVVQQAHEAQLLRFAAKRAKDERKIDRLKARVAELESQP